MNVHVVFMQQIPVDAAGNIVVKNVATIAQRIGASEEPRVKPDANIPSSANYPTLKTFLELEAAAGFKAAVVTNTVVVTYNG